MVRRFSYLLVVSVVLASAFAQPQSPRSVDASDLRLALKKLSVLGSVLYVAAHPDDDNTAFLGYMAKGRLMRAAYLSVTRGEGGQNLIGSEQGDLLGVIRTQELLASRRIDGAEQYFTRAIDFGFSKSLDETMNIWGKEKILSDVVWLIRSYRPDVVVTRFTPTQGMAITPHPPNWRNWRMRQRVTPIAFPSSSSMCSPGNPNVWSGTSSVSSRAIGLPSRNTPSRSTWERTARFWASRSQKWLEEAEP
jgi:hypothetical protein